MRFLYSGGGVSTAYGVITAPNHKGVPADIRNGKRWAADMGCLEGPDFIKKIKFNVAIKWLESMEMYAGKCIFIAGADVVFDAKKTLDAYEEFKRYFSSWPIAYVIQNGAEELPIPDDCQSVFLGGDTAYKESYEATTVIDRALKKKKHVHIGRVNSWRRYQLFKALPGSSGFTCDGTRQRFDGKKKVLELYADYESRIHASRQLSFPESYRW